MAAQPQISKDELQHIAAEVYKKNAELAIKNRAFSLLEKLYQASASGLDINPLCQELTGIIATSLKLPLVLIATKDKSDVLLRGVGGHRRIMKAVNVMLPERVEVPTGHIIRQVMKDKQRHATTVTSKAIGFLHGYSDAKMNNIAEIVCLPLIGGSHSLGVLVLCLPQKHAELTRFEQQTIRSLVQVVSIAIDRSTVYEDLKKANDRLKELDQLKTELLSIATHQLRTPLSIIKGYTSLLDEGAYGRVSKAQREILHNIDVSNERLINLVDEFLDVSRIEQGRTQYRFEEMDLRAVTDSVLEELVNKAEPKHIVLTSHLLESAIMVGDHDRLRHGVFNFVDNAIKYSSETSEVEIYLEKVHRGYQVRVIDHGPGLDENDIANLFQKFYRSPNVAQDFDGNGLGIFVVKEFIEAHGGRVWAKSDGIGKGSEFGFWVPTSPKITNT